ncbi:uncharacterized protein LOC127755244 [Oryza glaberrima]|nr:uncharacterized protein LOC127755244 [Oryza glaberrima]
MTEIQHSDLGEKASLVAAAAAAGEEHERHTSDLLRRRAIRLRRAELSKLGEDPERDRRDREATLIVLTLLLALAMPILLWLSAGEAPAPLLVWRLSLLLSTYFFLCANVLFVTKSFCAIVVDVYFGALLAYYADHVLGTRIGTVTIYLNSIFTAAFAGYALAERRRSDGTEQSADNVPAFADDEEEEYARAVLISSAAVISITLLFPTAYVSWMILCPYATTVEDVLRDLSYTILAYLFFATTLVTRHLLRGALLGDGRFYVFIVVFSIITVLPLFFAGIFGDVAGIVVIWLGIIALAVLFGYSVAIYSYYTQIQTMRSSQPPSEKADAEKKELDEISRDKLEHTSSPGRSTHVHSNPHSSASSSAEGSPSTHH